MEIFSTFLWNVRPELLELGPLTIRWYGLLFGVAFLLGYMLVKKQFLAESKDLRHLDSLLVWVVIGVLLGARLVHVMFYEPTHYFADPMRILRVWEGGLASHGGFLGGIAAIFGYTCLHRNLSFAWLVERVAVPAALGGACVRIGNFFNSEILGRPTDLPWGVVFAREDMVARHPVQLYEAAAYLVVFTLLLWLYNRYRGATPQGLLIGLFLALVFGARFLLEFLKARQAEYESGFVISVGQWLSVPFIVAGAWLTWRGLMSRAAPAPSAKLPAGPIKT